jgi:hypothetical protein
MFKKNPAAKQLSIIDPIFAFPGYVQDMLKNSWAEYFFHHIFSRINEERFSCLYSNNLSRPNTPVNVLVGLLILKELNRWTDEELIAALYFDYRVRYALGMSDFEKDRLCINTLGNFRKRLYQDSAENERDLLKDEMTGLTENLIELTGMDTSLARQDSMMISANCKKMGRLELIYTVNQAVAEMLEKSLPEELAHYKQEKDKADQIYRLKKEKVEERTFKLLKESLLLYKQVPEELKDSEAFKNLARLLEEQTDHLGPKDPHRIKAGSMQNPHEPEATYRVKGKKSSVGYAMNLVEARDREKDLSMIVHYEKEPNIISDAELGLNTVDEIKGVSTLVSDGSFYSKEMVLKAEAKGLTLSFSALNGRPVDRTKFSADLFKIDSDTELITTCPGGTIPVSATRDRKNELFRACFTKEDCSRCPHLKRCIVKEQKRCYSLVITEKKLVADRYRSLLGTPLHKALGDFRAGVEGVPSVLRRVYGIDDLPVRGLIRSRIWDHGKIMAYNFKSFFEYCRKNGLKALSCSFVFKVLNHFFRYRRIEQCYCF